MQNATLKTGLSVPFSPAAENVRFRIKISAIRELIAMLGANQIATISSNF